MIDFNGSNDGAIVHATGLSSALTSATISLWLKPSSSDFHILSHNNSSDLSIYLEHQRPVFHLLGMNQQSLPGTDNETFWSRGYLLSINGRTWS